MALLDTGAAFTAIDITAARASRLPVVDSHNASGATGGGRFPTFQGEVIIPLLRRLVGPSIRGLPLREQGFVVDAIIGRDVLCDYSVLVDGLHGIIRITDYSN